MGGLGYDPMGKLMQCLGRAPTGQLQESPGQRPGNSIAQRKSPEGARQSLHKFQYSKPQNALRNGESSNGNLRQGRLRLRLRLRVGGAAHRWFMVQTPRELGVLKARARVWTLGAGTHRLTFVGTFVGSVVEPKRIHNGMPPTPRRCERSLCTPRAEGRRFLNRNLSLTPNRPGLIPTWERWNPHPTRSRQRQPGVVHPWLGSTIACTPRGLAGGLGNPRGSRGSGSPVRSVCSCAGLP